jgi:hypothetical protein
MRILVELNVRLEQGKLEARIPNIPVTGEGETEDEAVANLKQSFYDYVRRVGLQTALSQFSFPSAFRYLEWDLAEIDCATRDSENNGAT